MKDYKVKKKSEIKKEVNRDIKEVKESEKAIDSVVKDCLKISELYKEIKDSPMTKDAVVATGKVMYNASKKGTDKFNEKGTKLEAKQKNLGGLEKILSKQGEVAKTNASKIRDTKDRIKNPGARTAMAKAENISLEDTRFADTERKKAEQCRKNSEQRHQAQKNKIKGIYFPGSDGYLAKRSTAQKIDEAIGKVQNEGKQGVEKDDLEDRIIPEEKQGHEFCEPVKEIFGEFQDEIERLKKSGSPPQDTKPHKPQQQDNKNNPAYGTPLGNEYKQDKS
ncbi:hypothetical protein ACFL3G_00065 [Planctomycetota bacterium]